MNKIDFIKKCPVCNGNVFSSADNIYAKCSQCESYVLFSNKSAEKDNKNYFNKIYKSNQKLVTDDEKSRLYKSYYFINKLINPLDTLFFNFKYKNIHKIFMNKKLKILEIGFGTGKRLINFLNNGNDAYGYEISEQAIKNFKKKYKKLSSRIINSDAVKKNEFDIIFCSALFEHIDNPNDFIRLYSQYLKTDGYFLIEALPVYFNRKNTIEEENDINFWKPCHRIIYNSKSLLNLFRKSGFKVIDWYATDDYNYRVLSLHKKYGYNEVSELRNSLLVSDKLPELNMYKKILKKALFIKSKALYGIFLFIKGKL